MTDDMINQYAISVVGIIKNRFDIYKQKNNDRLRAVDTISYHILKSTKYNFNYLLKFNLIDALKGFTFVIVICNSLCDIILFFFIFICFIITYSLVLNDIDERTFDFGILRTQGLQKNYIIFILILQTLSFSMAAFFCSIITSYSLNSILAFVFSRIIHYPQFNTFDWYTIIVVACISTIFPIFTNIISMNRVLNKYIRESIELLHNTISDVQISIVKLENMGISLTGIAVSLALIVCGGIAFYLVPFAIMIKDYELFLFAMQIILFFMLIGTVLLLTPFLNMFHKLLGAMATLLSCDLKLSALINKNIECHKPRNNNTTIILTIITAFAIFSTASFQSQTKMIAESLCQFAGSEIKVFAFPTSEDVFSENSLRTYLDAAKQNNYLIDYSFVSYDLSNTLTGGNYPTVALSNLAKNEYVQIPIYAVEPHYLDSTYSRFTDIYDGPDNPFEDLYNFTNLLPNHTSVYDSMMVTTTQGMEFSSPLQTGDGITIIRCKWFHYTDTYINQCQQRTWNWFKPIFINNLNK